jgi:hypothetical protein
VDVVYIGRTDQIQVVPKTGGELRQYVVFSPAGVRQLVHKDHSLYWVFRPLRGAYVEGIGDGPLVPPFFVAFLKDAADLTFSLGNDAVTVLERGGSPAAKISRAPYSGGTLALIESGNYALGEAIEDGGRVYFTDLGAAGDPSGPSGPTTLYAMSETGAGKQAIATLPGVFLGPVADPTTFYFADVGGSGVHCVARGGGADTSLLDAGGRAAALAVDATGLVWATSGDSVRAGSVHILPRR